MNPAGVYQYCFLNEKHDGAIALFGQALSSEMRVRMIRALSNHPSTMTELARACNTTNANVLFHLDVLQKAGLVYSSSRPGGKGHTQVYFLDFLSLTFDFMREATLPDTWSESMPVGLYVEADFHEFFRMATKDDFLRLDTNAAFQRVRTEAQLICTSGARLTYAFGNDFTFNRSVKELRISFEICSEAQSYQNDWKSDITFSINGRELTTYTSPGDYGGIAGKLNPDWWPDNFTQFGDLVTLSANDKGIFVNQVQVRSDITLEDLAINRGKSITFTLETKRNAKHYGGFNLFGESFGNHAQDILLTAIYRK